MDGIGSGNSGGGFNYIPGVLDAAPAEEVIEEKNNDGISDEDFASLWKENAPEAGKSDTSQAQQAPQQAQQQVDPQTVISQHLQEVGIKPFQMTDAHKEALQRGNVEEVLSNLIDHANNQIQTAYFASLQRAKTFAEASANKAKDEAIQYGDQSQLTSQIRTQFKQKFPQYADPAIAPVAESIIKRALDKGSNIDQAFKMVDSYMRKIANSVNESGGATQGGRYNRPSQVSDWERLLRD